MGTLCTMVMLLVDIMLIEACHGTDYEDINGKWDGMIYNDGFCRTITLMDGGREPIGHTLWLQGKKK